MDFPLQPYASARAALNRHNAPPVVYPLGRSPFLGSLLLGWWFAGFVSILLWWRMTQQDDWRTALALLAVLGAGIAARIGWNNLPNGQLAWDGEVWRWESSSYQTGIAEHELWVVADFQQKLLLRLENQACASLWLWVEQSAMPERWLDFRRAVYSPHKSVSTLTPHDFLPVEPSSALPPSAAAASAAMHKVIVQRVKHER